jgi:two-component system sensor histidine kinase RpfC
MGALLRTLKERLAVRRDNEQGQAAVRIALISLILMYVLLPPVREGLRDDQYQDVLMIVLGGLILAWALAIGMLVRPERSDVRRIVGMCADYGLMAAGMIQMGEPLSWVYVVVMWVTIGNGLRYGNRYLYAAVFMAMVSFTTTVLMTPYWLQNLKLGIGLIVGLAAVPLYFSGLLRKLTRAGADARRASEAKSRFLANMSHEFRTPLNGLSGMTEVLATTRLDGEQRECLNTIQASARSLLALVEEVLDISAIEAGKLRLDEREFSPRELIQHVGFIMLPEAKAKRLDYTVSFADDVPQLLRGDARHLRQILINLVGNAVKFTERGGIRIQVSSIPSEDSCPRLRFTVIDTGIGIPARLKGQLFEAFEQGDVSLSRRYGGTGLGTAIAKGLTEAMGGSIGFESEVGLGSTFWVEMPFRMADPEAALALVVPVLDGAEHAGEVRPVPVGATENVIAFSDPFLRHRARVRSMHILVADDHEANRMVLQRLLQKAGHRVSCVNGGEEVLDAMAISDYDAVIIDLHMPGMSGLDLLTELRVMQAGGAPLTPIMVLSADVTPESIGRCEQAGAYAFLAKPVAASKLLDYLNDIAVNGSLRNPSKLTLVRGPEKENAQAGQQYDVLDPRALDELVQLGMGEGFEQEFIRQCLSDADACVAGLSHAGEQRDWERVREHAHALKGVAGNLGLARLAEESGRFMRMADWQVQAEWRQRTHQIHTYLAMGREALNVRAAQRRRARDGGAER